MDQDIFGGRPPLTPKEIQWHQEMKRQEYDVVRIKNPRIVTVQGKLYDLPAFKTISFTPDVWIMYDVGQYQKVPYGAVIDVPRARARLFATHRKDEIVNFVTQKMHDEFIDQRRLKGFPEYTDKAIENKETYESAAYPKTNDPQIISEIFDQLILGITVRATQDTPPPEIDPHSGEVDLKPADAKGFDQIASRMVDNNETPTMQAPAPQYTPHETVQTRPVVTSPFSALNQKLDVNDVTNE